MILLFPIFVVLVGISTWLFFRFSLATEKVFSWFALGSTFAISVGLFAWTYHSMQQTNDSAWWPVVGSLYVMLQFPLCLLLAGVFRKLKRNV